MQEEATKMAERVSREELREISEHVLYKSRCFFELANRLRAHVEGDAELP